MHYLSPYISGNPVHSGRPSPESPRASDTCNCIDGSWHLAVYANLSGEEWARSDRELLKLICSSCYGKLLSFAYKDLSTATHWGRNQDPLAVYCLYS